MPVQKATGTVTVTGGQAGGTPVYTGAYTAAYQPGPPVTGPAATATVTDPRDGSNSVT
jgi:hypothetical protein